jgi:hypothetical protein
MKISIAVALLILVLGAGFGWRDYQHVIAAREIHGKLVAEAARLGIDGSLTGNSNRVTKHPREDRGASARRFAAEFIALGKELKAVEKSGVDPSDEGAQQRRYQRMSDFNQRMSDFIEIMVSLDSDQMRILLAEIGSDDGLSDEARQHLMEIAMMVLSSRHPQVLLAMATGSSGIAGSSDTSCGHYITASLARWAKDDPEGALEWTRKNPDFATDDTKLGLIYSVAGQDPVFAFKIIGELGVKVDDYAIQNLVGAAQTQETRSLALAALRGHLGSLADDRMRAERMAKSLGTLCYGVRQEGFESATRWLAEAKLTPEELAAFTKDLGSQLPPVNESKDWIEWLDKTQPSGTGTSCIQVLVWNWADSDFQAVATWLEKAPAGPAKTTAIGAYAEMLSRYQPGTAAQWVTSLPLGPERDATLRTIYRNWPKNNSAAIEAAAAFAKEHGIE